MASGGAPSGQLRPSPSGRQQRMLSRAPTRAFTMRPDGFSGEDGVEMEESELVPSSLAPIVPILRAANEIEEENPRVAYLCMCPLLLLSLSLSLSLCAHQMLLIPCLCLTRSFCASRGYHVTRDAVVHYIYTSSWNMSVSPGCRLPTHQHHRVLYFLSS
jgi:hypothetical protein